MVMLRLPKALPPLLHMVLLAHTPGDKRQLLCPLMPWMLVLLSLKRQHGARRRKVLETALPSTKLLARNK